jgi:CoA:oxalate CoA-transferase
MSWLPRDDKGTAPLSGVRVLDLSELLPGPFMTQALVELGADVLKVERPPHGDNVRRMSPALFDVVNRGKRSLLIDLKDTAQRERVLKLVDEADVLVEGYRPGVTERLGLGPKALLERNPRLIYVSLTGYGATGPQALLPGHDLNYLAAAGVVSLAATDTEAAPKTGVPMADLGGAIYALASLNAALYQRERTGRGQHLDVSITDCMAHWMNPRLAVLRHAGAKTAAEQRAVVQKRPAYGVFTCGDGGQLSVAALEDHFFAALVKTLKLDAYAGDAWKTMKARVPEAAEINDAVQAALSRLALAEATEVLTAADVPVAVVATSEELPTRPQFVARGLYTETAAGMLCRFPVAMDGVSAPPQRSPELGKAGEP